MADKSAKSRSPLKPRGAKKQVVPRKKPRVKTPIKQKTKAQIQKEIALQAARTRVKLLKSTLAELRTQISVERTRVVPDPLVLQAEIASARSQLERVQSELGQAKALSTKRKNEIDEWKGWYEKLPDAEKPTGLVSLQNEINWRAAELDSNAQRINGLMLAEIEAMGALEMANQKLAAVEAGVHTLPIEKDPRLKGALREFDKAVAAVEALTSKRPEKR
jgi:hypothetical protein